MNDTPRTDREATFRPNDDGITDFVRADFARSLERENRTFRAAQKACEDCDAPTMEKFRKLRELCDRAEDMLARAHVMLDGWQQSIDWHNDYRRDFPKNEKTSTPE